MFGSDWPAGLPAVAWKAALALFTQSIGAQWVDVREQLLGGAAAGVYRIGPRVETENVANKIFGFTQDELKLLLVSVRQMRRTF